MWRTLRAIERGRYQQWASPREIEREEKERRERERKRKWGKNKCNKKKKKKTNERVIWYPSHFQQRDKKRRKERDREKEREREREREKERKKEQERGRKKRQKLSGKKNKKTMKENYNEGSVLTRDPHWIRLSRLPFVMRQEKKMKEEIKRNEW